MAGFRERTTHVAMYLGAGLGALGASVVSPMLPQIADSLGTTVSVAAMSLTAYFAPFAVLQLVSGTLGERWGRRRTAQLAFVVYALAAVGCVIAPNISVFMVARVAMGCANAFTTPMLLAALAEMVPPHKVSRAVGLFASCLAAGQSFAPVIGGLTAEHHWQTAFFAALMLSFFLIFFPPPGGARARTDSPRIRALMTPTIALIAASATLSYLGATSIPFLVALFAEEHMGLSNGATGILLLGFGLAGLLLGATFGAATDRLGATRAASIGAAVTAVCVATVGFSHNPIQLAVLWALAGCGATLLTVALQNMAIRVSPNNKAGALSLINAFRFGGAALAPMALTPLYHSNPTLAFAVAGSALTMIVPVLALLQPKRPGPAESSTDKPGQLSAMGTPSERDDQLQ